MKSFALACALILGSTASVWPARAQMTASPEPPKLGTGVLSADEVAKLLPPAVYFKGQSAPLQLRNAGAVRFSDGAAFFASLVDTSGYSTSVREKYQFYLVTEFPMRVGDHDLPPGAYGAGFLNDGTFVVMDLGAHDLFTGKVQTDAAMRRPRPLQIVADHEEYRLYLGRQFVPLHPMHAQ